ncbi:hypothetical protein PFY12_05790 [Chryseobacterium camelliae]|uniref:Uncharacterized protein n=1 Tax=Chryseobacterium camelliae TaxID=1265445 RepID=A0ABY7QR27_9FLAO|nr:hypothetical protein [Chryseobacterium camelliae]WBV61633.1 hypothetical protein PFY12_05790 [Chryseobacterium camelliae]
MRELNLIAEVVFLEIAKESFNFPITESIRLSFWIPNDKISTFSEIQIQKNATIDINKPILVKINLLERDFLINKIKEGSEFKMGIFPKAIAFGKIIEVSLS